MKQTIKNKRNLLIFQSWSALDWGRCPMIQWGTDQNNQAFMQIAPGVVFHEIPQNWEIRQKVLPAIFELYPKRFIKNRGAFIIMWLHEGGS
ncbi:MAG: hypothetical protein EOM76_11255 [Sphingobacteriia bacterium]|nr:hypothetical protein [Sphingobacteriia bacterium]